MPISAEPASITAALASESSANVIGLTTFSSTTTPTPVEISSSVSSNGHTEKTNGVGPFPIFWSHTCWVSVFTYLIYHILVRITDFDLTVLSPRPMFLLRNRARPPTWNIPPRFHQTSTRLDRSPANNHHRQRRHSQLRRRRTPRNPK